MAASAKLNTRRLAVCAVMAAVMCIIAPVSIPIGPISITGGTLAIYLSVYLLGGAWGTASVLVYLLVGFVGAPVFSNYMGGAARLLGNPEFYDAHKARALLEFLSDKNKVFALTQDHKPQMLNIRIGPENGQGVMEEASFIFTAYDLGEDTSGVIGVIGPTRMDYSKIASRLLLLSRGLQGLMPIRFPEEEPGEDDNR